MSDLSASRREASGATGPSSRHALVFAAPPLKIHTPTSSSGASSSRAAAAACLASPSFVPPPVTDSPIGAETSIAMRMRARFRRSFHERCMRSRSGPTGGRSTRPDQPGRTPFESLMRGPGAPSWLRNAAFAKRSCTGSLSK